MGFLYYMDREEGRESTLAVQSPVHSCIRSFFTCTVDAYTLPGAMPGARDTVVSTAESALMRPTPTGRQISKEAITFHYDRDI